MGNAVLLGKFSDELEKETNSNQRDSKATAQRTNHECQIGRPEALMRCAKNLINSITPPMNAKINPQIFSVLGVNMHIGTTSNENKIIYAFRGRG
jgi:hypothetical protein